MKKVKNIKVFSLIWAIVALILSGFMIYVCHGINAGLAIEDGLVRLSLVVLIPVIIIVYVIMIAASVTATTSSIRTMCSDIKGIKITGIVTFVLSFASVGASIWVIVDLFVTI